MAGRPPKDVKKIQKAVYFEPHVLGWLEKSAEKKKITVSVLVNLIVEGKMNE